MLKLIIPYICIGYQLIKLIIYRCIRKGESDSFACLVGKTAIVTGGNSGIGYGITVRLASRGCRVIIADVVDSEQTRNSIIERTSNQNVTSKHLDLSSLNSVRRFAEEIKKEEDKIDILVNNAGIGVSDKKCTEDQLNHVMQTNFFGAFLLTHLLVERLKAAKGAKVVFTGSCLAYLSELTLDNMKDTFNPLEYELNLSNRLMLYENSKLCNILAAQEFAEKLSKNNIIVNSADPGIIRTKLLFSPNKFRSGFSGDIIRKIKVIHILAFICGEDPFQGARTSFHLACSDNLKEIGQHFYYCAPLRKPKILENRQFCREIWKRSEELVQLRPEEKL